MCSCKKESVFVLYVVITLFVATQLSAQSKFSDDLSLDINYQTGVILPEYQFINYITQDYCRSIDIALIKASTGKIYWEQLFNYPQVGVAARFSNLGNEKVLGKEQLIQELILLI